ncbi:unnamed protein product, partial [Staurois parvus]
MIRCLLGHMKGPRRRRPIHKAKRFSHLRSGHPAKREGNFAEVGAGTCQIQVPAPPPSPKVSSLWSFPALSAVSGHSLHCLQSLVIPCTVCSLWSSPAL